MNKNRIYVQISKVCVNKKIVILYSSPYHFTHSYCMYAQSAHSTDNLCVKCKNLGLLITLQEAGPKRRPCSCSENSECLAWNEASAECISYFLLSLSLFLSSFSIQYMAVSRSFLAVSVSVSDRVIMDLTHHLEHRVQLCSQPHSCRVESLEEQVVECNKRTGIWRQREVN